MRFPDSRARRILNEAFRHWEAKRIHVQRDRGDVAGRISARPSRYARLGSC
jgi:hypothetical protein